VKSNASSRPARCAAFTVIELIVIIVILGVMVTIVLPMIGSGSDISRVRTATRGVLQLSRYARTMAILRQNAVELTFTESGKLSVVMEAGGGGGESIVSAKSFSTTNAVAAAEEARMAEFEVGHGDSGGAGSGGGGGYVSMSDVNTEQAYKQVQFIFLGYTDTADAGRSSHLLSPTPSKNAADDEGDADGENARTMCVRYKSNGTVRPYRVKVAAEGDNAFSLTVAVDMLGSARVEEDEK